MLPTSTTSIPTDLERSAGVELNFNSSLHAVIIFLITTLGDYLQFQYQSQNKSLLEEHRKMTVAIYANLFLYGVGFLAEFKLKNQRSRGLSNVSIIKRITPLFGILVVVLILILLYPVLGFVALIVWSPVAMEAVIKLFEEFLHWFWPLLLHARETVAGYFNRAENPSPGIQENSSATMKKQMTF